MPTEFPHVTFLISKEYLDENGLWNPRDDDQPLKDGLQINVFGSKEHYLKLADTLRRFAEKDTSHDGDYHEHFDDFHTANGKVRLHIILRKDDVGDSIWKPWFPTP